MTSKKTDVGTPPIITPEGKHQFSNDTFVVLGVFVADKNRAMAVAEVNTILEANVDPMCWGLKVRDAFKELEAAKLIRECPTEKHENGTSRYRLV